MPARPLSPQDLQKIHDLAKQWGKIVVRRAFGDDGPGLDVDLSAMEQVAGAAARGLTAAPWRRPPASKPTASATPSPVPPAAGRARLATTPAPSTSAAGSSCTTSPWPTARPAAGIFSPQRLPLGLDTHGYSPVVLLRLVTAAGQLKSFDLAAQMARLLAEVPISGRHLG